MEFELKNLSVNSVVSGGTIRENNGNLDELKASIKEHGLLQPITVYLEGGKYTVKAGFRRFQAYKELSKTEPKNFQEIPCIVSDEKNKTVVQLVENIHRRDLTTGDLCRALMGLRKQGMNNQAIADVLGKKKTYVDNLFSTVKELENNEPLKELVTHVNVSLTDVLETKGVPDEKTRLGLLEKRGKNELSQKELRKKVKELKPAVTNELKPTISISGPNFKLDINIELSDKQRKELKKKIQKVLEEFEAEIKGNESEAV